MPQFDLFIWVSLSFWTIFIFQSLYYALTFFILSNFSNFQKTLIKLNVLKSNKEKSIHSALLEFFVKIYLQKINKY